MSHITDIVKEDFDVVVVHGLRPEIHPLMDLITEYCKEHGLTHAYTVNNSAHDELMQRKIDWSSVSSTNSNAVSDE